MNDRDWWALQISLVIFVTALSSVVYINMFGADPCSAILGSMLGAWIGVGVNLYQRTNGH